MATPRRLRLLLLVVLLVGGALRFYGLDWNDHAWPHPDERAVASQTFDMLVRDDYRPTIHTWGHFGYYSTLFAYKAFLWLQHVVNGVEVAPGERMTSVSGSVPHFRELAHGSGVAPLGLLVVVAGWLVGNVAKRALRRRRVAVVVAGVSAVVLAVAAPTIREACLQRVTPDYDDVILLGRFLSALASTASIALVYGIGARLYRPAVGLLAAAFLAVAVVPIQLAHFYIVDPVQAFAVLAAMWLASILLRAEPEPPRPQPGMGQVETVGAAPELAASSDAHPEEAGASGAAVAAAFAEPPAPPALRRALASVRRAAAATPWATLALYPLTGVAVGVALASKFSSIPLLALPFVAHVLAWPRVGRRAPLASHAAMLIAYGAALATWFALHPYAWEGPFEPFGQAVIADDLRRRWLQILFSRDFAAQILEQSLMVQGRAGGPWVQQFAGTTPYLTLTTQLVRFSLGWPLGLVVVGGFLWAALRNLRRPQREDLLLLSWSVVFFLALGSFQATFTRYTAPLIPFLCLFGALWCLGRHAEVSAETSAGARWSPAARRRAGRTAAALALAGGLLYSVAFVRIYARPHAWTYASLWIFENVPASRPDGAPTRIAHEEWDDNIPLSVPPLDAQTYGSVAMAPYHGDGDEKVARIAGWLEDADWICLPTTRLYSTILTVPNRYPVTAAYYKALFAGRLGFTLRRTVWEQPRIWGLAFDDLVGADESHHVYDHPKAVLFEKTEQLDRAELERRLRDLPPAIAGLTREDLLRWRESTREQVANVARDPYVEESVMTRDELDRRVYDAGLDDATARAFLDAVDKAGEAETPAIETREVTSAVTSVAADPDASELAQLRRRVESLETRPSYRSGDLRRLAEAVVVEPEARDRLVRRLLYTVKPELLPRSAVLAKLDRVEIGAGGLPAGREQAAAPARGRRVEVVAGGGRGSQIGAVLAWIFVLEVFGLAVLPWSLRIFSGMPGAGYPLAKTLGWVLATYLTWLLVNFGLARFDTAASWAAVAALAIAAWAPPSARRGLFSRLGPLRPMIACELLFVGAFVATALVRAWNPEIFWGEKTMDFSLLNSVLRGGTLPPYESWFSGVVLNYYYYGFVMVGFLTLLTGTPTAIAFNLGIAVVAALTIVGAFAVAYALTRRIRWGLAGAALVGLVGNLDPIWQLTRNGYLAAAWRERFSTPLASDGSLFESALRWLLAPWTAVTILFETPGRGSLWDSYWATSRALSDGMINEYPVWSWLFADLHAHVLAMPLALLAIALLCAVFLGRESALAGPGRRRSAATWGALAVVLGALAATNSWDFIAYSGLLVLALTVVAVAGERAPAAGGSAEPEPRSRGVGLGSGILFIVAWTVLWSLAGRLHPYWLGVVDDWWIGLLVALALVGLARLGDRPLLLLGRVSILAARVVRVAILPAAAVILAGMALYFHFHSHLDLGDTTLRSNRDGFITVVHALRHFGLFALLTMVWFVAVVSTAGRGAAARLWSVALLAGAALLAAALVLSEPFRAASGFALYVFLLAAVAVAARYRDRAEDRFAAVLLAGGWGLAAVSELVVLSDRMNTVFKLYHPAWMMLAVGSAAALGPLLDRGVELWLRRLPDGRVRLRPLPVAATVMVAAALFVCVACTWRGVVAVVSLERKPSDRPTLDGLDFLRHTPAEAELLEAVTWLNDNVEGPQVVAEAFTDRGYDESARVAQYTGLPILLGWPHHIKQRGRTQEQIALREADLVRLYTSPDAAEVAAVCRRYDIRYVFLGDLERRQYGRPEDRFVAMPFLRPAFRSSKGSYVVYEVSDASPAIVPAG